MGQPTTIWRDTQEDIENAHMMNKRQMLRKKALTVRFQRTMG